MTIYKLIMTDKNNIYPAEFDIYSEDGSFNIHVKSQTSIFNPYHFEAENSSGDTFSIKKEGGFFSRKRIIIKNENHFLDVKSGKVFFENKRIFINHANEIFYEELKVCTLINGRLDMDAQDVVLYWHMDNDTLEVPVIFAVILMITEPLQYIILT